MARPDHGRAGRAEHRQRAQRPLDVRVADVAENAAHENEVGRDRAGVAGGRARVTDVHLQIVQAERVGMGTRATCEFRVELDEQAADVAPLAFIERTEQVARFSGTHAHNPQRRPIECVEHRADAALNDREPAAEGRIRVVLGVPFLPIQLRTRHRGDAS